MRLLFALMLLLGSTAYAQQATYQFETPEQEQRFSEITKELRCLVCQGQSIGDSDSELANDLKVEVRRMILAGQSDAEIVDFMVARYGDFVLFRPPVKTQTYLLWFGPALLLLIGLIVAVRLIRRPAAPDAVEPSRAELARARALLDEPSEEDAK